MSDNQTTENIIIDYGNGYIFDGEKAIDATVDWIRDTIHSSGGKLAVIGISGGKDSSVVAALCARALGAENVIGVKMADGGQNDFQDQDDIIKHLGIKCVDFDIGDVMSAVRDTASMVGISTPGDTWSDNTVPEEMWNIPNGNKELYDAAMASDDYGIYTNDYELPYQAATNLPARIRLTVLYMIAQSLKDSARVVGTANLSEGYIGWDTRYGGCGGSGCDILPLANYTATEVIMMGRALGLPVHLTEKPPADGLSGKTDEDNFGFTYEQLDDYIRRGNASDTPEDIRKRIDEMHARNEFKMHMPPACPSGLDVAAASAAEKVENNRELDEQAHLRSIFKNMPHVKFPKRDRQDIGMDVTFDDDMDMRGLMAPCPKCLTNENLRIKCDLVTLNALEYWVECDGCGQKWTDRMLGREYAETESELIEAWNAKMGGEDDGE